MKMMNLCYLEMNLYKTYTSQFICVSTIELLLQWSSSVQNCTHYTCLLSNVFPPKLLTQAFRRTPEGHPVVTGMMKGSRATALSLAQKCKVLLSLPLRLPEWYDCRVVVVLMLEAIVTSKEPYFCRIFWRQIGRVILTP